MCQWLLFVVVLGKYNQKKKSKKQHKTKKKHVVGWNWISEYFNSFS